VKWVLLEGKNPVRVVAFNTAEKWSEDVSADEAHELRRRCDLQMRDVPNPRNRKGGDEMKITHCKGFLGFVQWFSKSWIALMAEGVGFEPTVPLQARRFSRPVP
jgi:hypothetical protein